MASAQVIPLRAWPWYAPWIRIPQSSAPDNHGVYSAVMCWKEAFAGLVPVWMMTGLGMTMGVGAIMCAVCLGVGFVLFARPKKA